MKKQVDDVVGVMRGNVSKVLDRGEKLSVIEDKSGDDDDDNDDGGWGWR